HLSPSKLRIIVDHGDFAAPPDSIARLSAARELQVQHNDVTLLLLTKQSLSPLDRHIASMADNKARFSVSQIFADREPVDLGVFKRTEIPPFVTVAVYQQMQGKLPAVWRVTPVPGAERGGVEFAFAPVSAGALPINLADEVLGNRVGHVGVWDIQVQEGH